MIRLLIADDHSIFRQGLRRVLEFAPEIEVVADAGSGDEVLQVLAQERCNLLLLDLSMPPPSGIGLIRQVRGLYPALPILVLSVHDESELAALAIQSGARGYLTKDGEPEDLIAAVRTVARGGHVLSASVANKVIDAGQAYAEAPHRRMTDREWQVFSLLVSGVAVGDIAQQLQISRKTVSTYKQRLMQKLAIDNEADLVRYALRHGLGA